MKDIKKIEDFIKKNKDKYSKEDLEIILREYTHYDYLSSSLVHQIYDELGLVDEEHNVYGRVFSLLANAFDINRQVIEVGGGAIPSFGKRIALSQKHGSVTVYDPRLIYQTTDISNLSLKKENFDKDSTITSSTLLVGYKPELGSEAILKEVERCGCDFFMALSDVYLDEDLYEMEDTLTSWQKGIIHDARDLVRDKGLGRLVVTTLEDPEYDIHPIIYNKRQH